MPEKRSSKAAPVPKGYITTEEAAKELRLYADAIRARGKA
jgi:hypothetical protein